MPKGVATLEDLERHARAPPGFGGQPNLLPKASQAFAGTHPAGTLPPGSATQPQPAPWGISDAPAADNAAAQESGKALLSLLSKPSSSVQQQPAQQPGSPAITPLPGFPGPTKPQAPISWGSSSQLQGIWGAPTPSSSGSQATWGAPAPATRSNSAQAQLPPAYSLQNQTAEQEAGGPQPHGWPSSVMQTAVSTPGSLPNHLNNGAMQGSFSTTGQLDAQQRAGSIPVQPEMDSMRGSIASNASNPLLALLGQQRSSMTQGMPCSSSLTPDETWAHNRC